MNMNDVLGLNPNAVPVPDSTPEWAQGAAISGTVSTGPINATNTDPNAAVFSGLHPMTYDPVGQTLTVTQSANDTRLHVKTMGSNLVLNIPAEGPATHKDLLASFNSALMFGRGISKVQVAIEGESEIKRLAARMKHLESMYDLLEAVRKEMNNEYDMIRLKSLPDLMAEEDIRTMTIEGIGRVQLGSDVYASIVGDKKEPAYKWLRDHNYGDLIQETVNSSTLKSFVKEYQQNMEEGKEELPAELFKVQPFLRVSIVKAAAKGKGKK